MSAKRVLIYSFYERIWHWLQAVGILALIVSGFLIHFPELLSGPGFEALVHVHNVLGFLLIANAFLGLFYYLTTGIIKQFIPKPKDFFSLAIEQIVFYIRGIFRGQTHPLEKTPERRLNPLQQITYLVILNFLLPLQMLSGFLMWGAQKWPEKVETVGGLSTLGVVHTLGAWLFVSFIVLHVYLTTTGKKPLTHIKSMLTGYDEVESGG